MDDLISRQAAIDALKAARVEDDGTYQWRTQRNLDLEFAAALLENIPPAQPASCEDAVSRKAVAGIYTALWETIGTIMDRDEWDDVCKATANELPPAQPERKLQKLAEEIAAVKRSIKSENGDYLTGYLSALSVVEGMIAGMREVTT